MGKAPTQRSLLKSEVRLSSSRWRKSSDSRTVKNPQQEHEPCCTVGLDQYTQLGLIPDRPPLGSRSREPRHAAPPHKESTRNTRNVPFKVHVADRRHGLSRLLSPAHRSRTRTPLTAGGSDASPGPGCSCSAPTRSGTRMSPGPQEPPCCRGRAPWFEELAPEQTQ